MQKFLTLAVALWSVVTWTAAAGTLDKYVPDTAQVLVEFNTAAMLAHPLLQEIKAKNSEARDGMAQFDALCAKYGFAGVDVIKRLLIAVTVNSDSGIGLVETAVPEAKLPEFFAELNAVTPGKPAPATPATKLEAVVEGGRRFYTLQDNPAGKPVAITYLAANVIAILPWDDAGRAMLQSGRGKNPLSAKLDSRMLVSAAFVVPPKMVADKEGKMVNRAPIGSGVVNLNVTGAAARDLWIQSLLTCPTPEARQQLAMQLQIGMPMMLGMMFGQDQQLSLALAQAIVITAPGNDAVCVEAKFPEALLTQMIAYAEKQKNAAATAAPAASVPATTAPAQPR